MTFHSRIGKTQTLKSDRVQPQGQQYEYLRNSEQICSTLPIFLDAKKKYMFA